MPKPVAELEQADPAVLAPEIAVVIKVRDVGKFLGQPQRRIATMDRNRGLQRTKLPGEFEMLLRRQMLARKDQDGVFRECFLDRSEIGRREGTRQVDVSDLGGEARRDGTDVDGHGKYPPGAQCADLGEY